MNSNIVLVIAPHPDDETLGCGGSILKHTANGDEVHWLIVTSMLAEHGWSSEEINGRNLEISKVASSYNFKKVHSLSLPASKLDQINFSEIVKNVSAILNNVKPNLLYMPFAYDVHTDHQIIARAVQSSIKPFRCPFLNRVLVYETLSETGQNQIEDFTFTPNVFINIDHYIDQKLEIMKIYKAEIGIHPFPRSEKAIRALSALRGSQSNNNNAEAFRLTYECL